MLGPTDRGYLALLVVIPTTIAQIGALGLSLAVTYFIARRPRAARAILAAVKRPILLQVGVLTATHVTVVALVIAGKPDRFVLAAIFSVGLIPSGFALEYGLATLQGAGRYSVFNILRVAPALGYATVLIILFVASAGTIAAVLVASLASQTVFAAVALVTATAGLSHDVAAEEAPTLRQIVRFGLESYLGYVSPMESFRLDQVYIAAVLPPAALGIYVVGVAFTNIVRFIGQGIGSIAIPHVASLHERHAQLRSLWRFFALAVGLCGAITLALLVTIPWLVPLFFGKGFSGAVAVSQILVLGAFFLAIRRVLTEGARGYGMPTVGSVAEVAAFAWFVTAVLVVAPATNVQGIAWAFTSSAGFGFVVLLTAFMATSRRNPHSRGRDSLGQ
jgi:O-antigen/teichoic acid export membrane protein